MGNCKRKKTGFTLIELLVVLAIIGMLAGIVLVSLGSARAKSRDVRRVSDIRQLVTAQQMYEGENGVFYATTARQGIPPIGNYMPAIDDPQNGRHYQWVNNTDNPNKFCAYAILEEKGNCTTNYRIFVGYEGGTKDVCVASLPPTSSISAANCAGL
jgi:prepilin-type N-terminal cleavage/methylation domain-containing protein